MPSPHRAAEGGKDAFMKKILISAITLFSLLLMLMACGGESDTKCTHADKNDDKKCDECSAAFEDGCDREHKDANDDGKCDAGGEDFEDGCDREHKDANDDGKCDAGGEDFEDGPEPAPPGTIYSDKYLPTVIYGSGKSTNVLAAAESVRDYMESSLSLSPPLFGTDTPLSEHEIILGDSERGITATAKALLAEKLAAEKAQLSDEDAKADLSGYLIYSDGSSVAIVWTDFQLAEAAADYFIKNYLTESSLVLEAGYEKTEFLSLTDYLEEREERIFEEKWAALAAAIPEEYREEIVAEFKRLYALYDDEVVLWLASLYDTETGGFYFSESARFNEGFLPDIETTYYCLTLVGYTGMAEMFGERWEDAIPEELTAKTAKWLISLQDEDGYFYHPQWPKDYIEKNGYQLRISRDRGSALTLITRAGFAPLYELPAAGTQSLTSPLGTDAESAVQKAAGSELLSEYASTENYRQYLLKQETMLKNMSDSERSNFFYTFGSYAQSNVRIMSDEIKALFVEFCDKHQNPENGVWSEKLYYSSTNAIHKIVSVYNSVGAEVKHVDKMVDSTLEILMWDPKVNAASNTCEIYNVWSCFPYIYKNIRNCSEGTEAERNALCDAIKARVYAGAAEALAGTYSQVVNYSWGGGTFSTYVTGTPSLAYGCEVAMPGSKQGDVQGFLFAANDIPVHAFAALELEDYAIPLFTEADRVTYVNALLAAEPVEKGALRIEEKIVYDFEEGELGSVPEGLNVAVNSGGTLANEGAYIKTVLDGDRKVLGIKSAQRNVTGGRNYSLTLNANPTDKFPTASRFEFSIKISTDTPALAKLLYFTQKPNEDANTIIQPYMGTDAEGNVIFYDSKGKNPTVIGKTGEYLSLVLDYDWVGGSYSLYSRDTLLGSFTANHGFTKHQMVTTLILYTDSNTEASIYLDNFSYTVYEKEAEK